MTKTTLLLQTSAKDINEWLAYYLLQDEKYKQKIESEMQKDMSIDDKKYLLRQILSSRKSK